MRDYLRKERLKDSFWSRFISDKTFCPQFWRWQRDSVAVGLGWGSFFAISPLPMQSLWAAGACVWKKGNIPIAILAAWLSPPGTLFFSIPLQWFFGSWLLDLTPLGTSGLSFDIIKGSVKEALNEYSLAPLKAITSEIGFWHALSEFLLGAVVSCTVLGIFCYFATHALWRIICLFRKDKPRPASENEEPPPDPECGCE